MPIQVREILENFPELLRLERGSAEHAVAALQDPTLAGAQDMIFVATNEHLQDALNSRAECWLVHPSLVAKVPSSAQVVLSSKQVLLAMAWIGRRYFPQTRNRQIIEGPKIAKTAVIAPTARLGENCIVGPGAVVGDHCTVGDGTIIGANAVVEPYCKIGAGCHIHPMVFIGHSCEVGANCEIHPHTTIGSEGFGYAQDAQINHHRITHYGRVVLEQNVHIGAGVQIDRGTYLDSRIGSGTRIDNHCHFGHNIQIGRNTIIVGSVIAAGSVKIGSYCVIGGRTTIAGHLEIGDRVQIGGMSGITKSILEPGQYAGFPIQDLKTDMRVRATIKKLPELARQVRQILKHLGIEESSEKPGDKART